MIDVASVKTSNNQEHIYEEVLVGSNTFVHYTDVSPYNSRVI